MNTKFILFGLLLLLCVISTDVVAYTYQGNFRWRNDDGSESAATWRKSQSTNDTLTGINNIRLRVELYNSDPSNSNFGAVVALFYSTDNSTFTQMTTDGSVNHWKLNTSDNFVNGDATTNQLTTSYTFAGGNMYESSNTFTATLGPSSSKEYELCISPTQNAVNGTTYYFKIKNGDGSDITGYGTIPTLYFVSLASSENATSVTTTSATLNGTVNPQGLNTTAYFLHGTSSGTYTDSVEADQSPLSNASSTSVSKTLSGLTAGTTYYYRVAKNNTNGYVRSGEKSFTTIYSEPTTTSSSASTTSNYSTATVRWTNGNGSSHIVVMKQSSAVNSNPVDGTTYTANSAFGSGSQIGSGNYVVAITSGAESAQDSVVVTGLQSNTNYYFAVYEFNGSGGSQNYLTSSSLTGNFTTQSHNFSYALSFDGVDDYANLPVTTSPTAYTVEMWVKPSVTTNANIFVRTDATGPNSAYSHQLRIENGKFAHYLYDGASYTLSSATTISANTWYHVAIVATNNGSMKLYLNGTDEVTGVTIGTLWTGGDRYYVGSVGAGMSAFQGLIDEIRIWNFARTIEEVAADKDVELNGNESGLIHYWKNNEGSGTSIDDATANNLAGTLVNGVAWENFETPLPVELTSFAVSAKQNAVELKWQTATEVNNFGFEIERRAISDRHLQGDGHFAWSKVSFVEGYGNSNSPKEYSYADKNLSNGTYSYRLKQIDRDGKFEYSQSVEVTVANAPKEFA
ncbi:MAG: LamG-like jellyroll fold domain-containing protein, partial [Bacteroidota bacterium]